MVIAATTMETGSTAFAQEKPDLSISA